MFRKTGVLIGLLAASPALVAFANPLPKSAQGDGLPWWGWLLIIIVLVVLVLLIWWCLRRRAGKKARPAAETAAPARPVPPAPDDLERIEGIGPKIAGLLQAAGITTFAQLAATNVGRLKQILTDAGIRIADPTTWAEQARLAAAGKWDELQALQDKLKGGRQV
ncbi:MAG TPA: DUF4332 domain-containing protein [Anaerolineae bacterium]|nr:DUF4332 domain-containing protein [Anaerolineae bacterium]